MIEPLVFLPGLMSDARLLRPQIERLSQDRAVMIAPVSGGERIEEIASGLLDQLPQRFALAGHGLGGMVALELTRRAPERIKRLCLISTDAQADTPHIAAGREELIVGAQAGRIDDVMRSVMGSDALAPGPQRIPILHDVIQMANDLGPDLFTRQMRALQRRQDQQATLRLIKVPTLVLCGVHDTLTPVRRQRFMADMIPESQFLALDCAGHLPTLEAPEAVNTALTEWLQVPLKLF